MASSASRLRGLPSNPRSASQVARRSPAPPLPERDEAPAIRPSPPAAAPMHERAPLQSLRQQRSFHSGRRHHGSTSSAGSSDDSSFHSRFSKSPFETASPHSSMTSLSDSVDWEEDRRDAQATKAPGRGHGGASYNIDGISVWKSMTGVANLVSQEVNKVWANGVSPLNLTATESVEDDSHLVNVMRKYHLSKAATPADLPDWLFSERERGGRGLSTPTSSNQIITGPPSEANRARHATHDQSPTHSPRPLGLATEIEPGARPPRLPAGTTSASDRLRAKRSMQRMAPKI